MSKGNLMRVHTKDYRGRQIEGVIVAGETPKPGQIVQIQASSIPATTSGAKFTFELYNVAADGSRPSGPYIVLDRDNWQGKILSDAYAAGERAFGYVPLPGDELNLLIANISGTGDDHTKGEVLIVDDTTGKMIATAASPETEPAMLLESFTDPTADFHSWTIWSGY